MCGYHAQQLPSYLDEFMWRAVWQLNWCDLNEHDGRYWNIQYLGRWKKRGMANSAALGVLDTSFTGDTRQRQSRSDSRQANLLYSCDTVPEKTTGAGRPHLVLGEINVAVAS